MSLKFLHLHLHGLIRSNSLELGRDADTGGQTQYVLELVKSLANTSEVLAKLLINSKTYCVCPPVSASLPNSRFLERIRPCRCKCKNFKLIQQILRSTVSNTNKLNFLRKY